MGRGHHTYVSMIVAVALALSVVPFGVFSSPLSVAAGDATSAISTSTGPAPLTRVRLQDDDLRATFRGRWQSVWTEGSSGDTHRVSSTKDASAKVYFTGTSISLVSRKGPNRGRARVYIDGVSKGTIDLYAPSWSAPAPVWKSRRLTNTDHTFKLVVLGSKSSESSGRKVTVDAFDVVGAVRVPAASDTLVHSGSSLLAKRGSWWTSEQGGAYGDSALRSRRAGATLTMRFKGTRFAWIGRKDSELGKAEVLIDGKRVGTVSQYRSSKSYRRVAFAASGLPYATHNVTIRVLGKSSTGSGTKVDVDAFLTDGTARKAYPATPFRYPWATYIVIDKSQFKLYWVKKGVLIEKYPIAHGKSSTPTPSRVWRIDAKYYTSPGSVYGPRKMRMFKRVRTSNGYSYQYTRYAIHGTNEPWVIGTKASHGCIRMYNRDVLELFPQVPLHTMVVTRD